MVWEEDVSEDSASEEDPPQALSHSEAAKTTCAAFREYPARDMGITRRSIMSCRQCWGWRFLAD